MAQKAVIKDKLARLRSGQSPTTARAVAQARQPRNASLRLAEAVELTRGKALVYWDKTDDCTDIVVAELERLDALSNALFYGRRSVSDMRSRYGSLLDRITYLPGGMEYAVTLGTIDPITPLLNRDRGEGQVRNGWALR